VRAVAILTITGLVALVLALLTGSTPLAVVVVGLAVAGIVLLLRDWRDERNRAPLARSTDNEPDHRLTADEFSPDISADPDGPSSNARAD